MGLEELEAFCVFVILIPSGVEGEESRWGWFFRRGSFALLRMTDERYCCPGSGFGRKGADKVVDWLIAYGEWRMAGVFAYDLLR